MEKVYPIDNCVICNNPFPKTRRDRMCCSSTCSFRYTILKRGPYTYKKKYRHVDHPEKPCIVCSKMFKPKHFDTNYCSRSCRSFVAHAKRAENDRLIALLDGRIKPYKNTPEQDRIKKKVRAMASRNKNTKALGPCEECGTTIDIERHHDDYSKPLEIRFLCVTCHNRWHKYNLAKY